jgi:predicted AlkP superfamily pyrophosphatase or phosphodiesterase
VLCLAAGAFASAYNAHPKLIVVITIDQFRGDYLERYRDQFGDRGFRLFLDHGANFTDCNYGYANTRTAPGHATLFTGTYTRGHGIMANEWWDPQGKKMVTSVEDDDTRLVGIAGGTGASPHNLMADTLGDELKLATGGKARVFGIALKDRAAILPVGFSGNAAYWIDPKSGAWITSTYYVKDLPKWAADFNAGNRAEKYWNKEWKDAAGKTLRSTAPRQGRDGSPAGFYEVVGATPFANDYEFEFARELMVYEKVGTGPATDLLSISLSANDILGHQVGPDSPEAAAMTLATDRQLAEFFGFLGQQIGLANVWIALSADHGISPLPSVASGLHIPAAGLDREKLRAQMNASISSKLGGGQQQYVQVFDYPVAWLNQEAFGKTTEQEAERAVGEAMVQAGLRGFFTRWQLAHGEVPNTISGRRFLRSYSAHGGWYVLGVPAPFNIGSVGGTDHASPYSYDTHVPLAFYGIPFQTGTYRTAAEPVDLAPTLASLLGINAPASSVGRVLTEALTPPSRREEPPVQVKPAAAESSSDTGAKSGASQ